MKTILRNFVSVLRRFKMAMLLNVFGLSIAFAAFMVIMMQVNYDYTFDSCQPEADAIYRMDMDFQGLRSDIVRMLGGERVKINTRSFQNDMRNFDTKDDVLTLLVHLGYLGYDSETEEAFIPNKEIVGEFENAMSVSGWPEVMRILKASDDLLKATLDGDADSVARGLDQAHTEASSILTYNDENSLACAIGLAYYSARKDYRLIRELPSGKGYADVVFLPLPSANKPALVIELKYDKTVNDLDIAKDSYHEERQHEFDACIDRLRNTTIRKDAMYTLIAYAFKPGNEYLRDSMLAVLYGKNKNLFLGCFKKSEKSSQKEPGSIDFKGFSKFPYEEGREKNVS